MINFLKKYTIELIGVVAICSAALIFRDVTNSGMEGFERFAVLVACGIVGAIGVKIIQKADKCEK